MRRSSLQMGALKAGATFHDTDPENFVFLGLDRKIAHDLAPIQELLRGHHVKGTHVVSSRQKLIRRLEANKPQAQPRKPRMFGSVREAMQAEQGR